MDIIKGDLKEVENRTVVSPVQGPGRQMENGWLTGTGAQGNRKVTSNLLLCFTPHRITVAGSNYPKMTEQQY